MVWTPAYKTDDVSVYLTTVSDVSNADIVESLLHSYNIPVVRKFREAGDYLRIYMGSTCYGIDIYVPSLALEDAKDILKFKNENPDLQMSDEEIKLYTKSNRRRHVKVWIILLFFIPGFFFIFLQIAASMFITHH